jgi:hypothetical protein
MGNRTLTTNLELLNGGDVINIPELDYFEVSYGSRESLINNLIAFIFKCWDELVLIEDEFLTEKDLKAKRFMQEHFRAC